MFFTFQLGRKLIRIIPRKTSNIDRVRRRVPGKPSPINNTARNRVVKQYNFIFLFRPYQFWGWISSKLMFAPVRAIL